MKPSELRCFSTSTKEIAIQIHLRGEAHVGLNAGQVIQEFLYLGYWRGCAGVQGCAVRTPSLSNHYRMNKTDVSMDISERFSLRKYGWVWHQKRPLHEQWYYSDRIKTKNISSQHRLDAKGRFSLVMLALWDTFATDIAILSAVKHSQECPQGDEQQEMSWSVRLNVCKVAQ